MEFDEHGFAAPGGFRGPDVIFMDMVGTLSPKSGQGIIVYFIFIFYHFDMQRSSEGTMTLGRKGNGNGMGMSMSIFAAFGFCTFTT